MIKHVIRYSIVFCIVVIALCTSPLVISQETYHSIANHFALHINSNVEFVFSGYGFVFMGAIVALIILTELI